MARVKARTTVNRGKGKNSKGGKGKAKGHEKGKDFGKEKGVRFEGYCETVLVTTGQDGEQCGD